MSSLLFLKSMIFANAMKKMPKNKEKKTKTKKMPEKKLDQVSTEMCRICDQEKGEIPIFHNFIQPTIPEDILHFTGVTMEESDKLSKHMCQNCLDLLNGCIMFKEMCQKTNKKLIEMGIKKECNLEIDTDFRIPFEESNDTERKGDSDHDEVFEENSEFTCTHCGQNHVNLAALDRHVKKCKRKKIDEPAKSTEEAPKRKFLCDVCGKTSHSNASLLAHKVIHEAIFRFKCDECPYKGKTMDLLKVHKRRHLTVKPFKCPQCPKSTTTASNLAKHVRHVHSSIRPYKCNYCDKAFTFQHDMRRHIKDIHLRQGTVECEYCFKKFNTRKILRGHEWKVHKIKGERQGRLPAYLQLQMEEQNENHNNIDRVENEQANVPDIPF